MTKRNDYAGILSTVLAHVINYNRLNDLRIGEGTYKIGWIDYPQPDGSIETGVCLEGNGKQYGLSDYQLAALRCVMGVLTAKTLDTFKDDPNATNFQAIAKEIAAAGKSLENVSFKVVGQLTIKNSQLDNGTMLYQDRCYTGSNEFLKGCRNLVNGKTREFYKTAEYRNGSRALRDVLYATPLRDGMKLDSNLALIPVFAVL